MSVIDLNGKYEFGAVLLMDLLQKIYDAKSKKESNVPILIIIDEVHEFWNSSRGREAIELLSRICRKGRSLEISIIFASQTPDDMPSGLKTVVNTKIYFKPSVSNVRSLGIDSSAFSAEALGEGYAVANIHNLGQVKFIKFPLPLAGVIDKSN